MISVIVPVYNRKDLCLRAVRSVLSQSFKDFELIVVDDGSTEDMSEVRELVVEAGQLFVSIPHHGVSRARNVGVKHASRRWISFLDSDDSWKNEKLEKQINYLNANPDCKLAQCEELWIRNGKVHNQKERHSKPTGEAFLRSLELCLISPSSVVLERKLFLDRGGFDERMQICEDYDLWLRLTVDTPVGFIDEPLVVKYGGHIDQLSSSQVAIDRFRVFSMVKLLCQKELTDLQLKETLSMLSKKAYVVLEGARKRKNDRVVSLMERLIEGAEKQSRLGYGTYPQIKEQFGGSLIGLLELISERWSSDR